MGKKATKKLARSAAASNSAFHSPYASPIVRVYVQEAEKQFNVHEDVFLHLPVLQSQVSRDFIEKTLHLPKISAFAFHLVLQLLYGWSDDDLEKRFDVLDRSLGEDPATTGAACELLCFAFEYEWPELEAKVASYFQHSLPAKAKLILSTAITVYTTRPSISAWMQDHVYSTTWETLKAHSNLVDETWFVDIFEHGYNGLGKHLFICYKDITKTMYGGKPSSAPELVPESEVVTEPETALESEPVMQLDSEVQPVTESEPEPELDLEVKEENIWGSWGLPSTVKKAAKANANATDEIESIVRPSPPSSEQNMRMIDDNGGSPDMKLQEEEESQVFTIIDPENHNTCSKRSKHLRHERRWQACALCFQEVKAMALDASQS